MTSDELLAARAPRWLVLPADLAREVRVAYGGAGRAYHDGTHLEEIVQRFGEVAASVGWLAPREVYLAALFHDAVYVAGAKDNEAKSAGWARRAIEEQLSGQGLDAARVEALILMTARHGALGERDLADDPDGACFLDCDMAILGAERARYDAYERGVAAEYRAVPPEAFAAGRKAFLEGLLLKESIFLSAWGKARFEATARANVTRALGR
jgi:predicted metal-dependent HD superfamily phosphohydrolase